jgi:DeoR/GlpR family transcriptional regulator of sugar metabolism
LKKFERFAAIEKLLQQHDYVLIHDICQELDVSESTIRRDLDEMMKQNLLFRNQGAVIWNKQNNAHMENVYYRQVQNIDQKKVIAQLAAAMIQPGDTLFIDAGTTMLEMVRCIDSKMPLTVVTNDLQVALEFENKYNAIVVTLGGILKQGTNTVTGPIAVRGLDGMHFNKMFISPAGMTREGELMFYNMQALEERVKAKNASQELIAVMDSSKFDKSCFVTGFHFADCSALVTDRITKDWRTVLAPHMRIVTP